MTLSTDRVDGFVSWHTTSHPVHSVIPDHLLSLPNWLVLLDGYLNAGGSHRYADEVVSRPEVCIHLFAYDILSVFGHLG